ncbi:M23 family metallopeptidase [Anaerocellum diazotrophicum]|uniref:Peptidase M23 n=1 Tax=Caldicellulosiruptor diazotrophicus TaxID=2806205 RepID=A0ABM7NQ85_9FIRM|nr:M23 family metallopeptidase [Caldicellulosiruptor diazotrophicus]BCS82258.1 hypothetical protein CaldiYA01_22180 [Caldicellulosiruptor diazotrophicus]
MAKNHTKSKTSATATVLDQKKAKFVPKIIEDNLSSKQKDNQTNKWANKKIGLADEEKHNEKKTIKVEKNSQSLHISFVDLTKQIKSKFVQKLKLIKDNIRARIFKSVQKSQKPLKSNVQDEFIFLSYKYRKSPLKELFEEIVRLIIGLKYIGNIRQSKENMLKLKIFSTLALMFLMVFIINRMPTTYQKAYAVILNGSIVGYVKDKMEVQRLFGSLKEEISIKHGTDEFVFQNKPQLKEIPPGLYKNTSLDSLKNTIIEKGVVLVKRYALFVNSKAYLIFDNPNVPQNILNKLKIIYYKKDAKYAKFLEKVEIKPVYVKTDIKVVTEDQALNKIMFGKDEVIEYTIKEGDTLWDLARKYNISVDDIFASNPGLTEKIMPGQRIKLSQMTPLVNVVLEKEVEFVDTLPKEVKTIKSDKYYTTQTIVKQEGKNGKAKIKAKIVYLNGLEYDRQIISQQVLEKPVDRIVVIGTKKPPRYFATGRFSFPTWGVLTSRFGYRGREFHEGIDIAVPWGSNVYAADGGIVEFVGWLGGYGKLIIINHQNGYKTYYGHLSRFLVSPGQKVAKGQLIAKSGSTGRSTGPHLHFEVRKNGVPQNPLMYLR